MQKWNCSVVQYFFHKELITNIDSKCWFINEEINIFLRLSATCSKKYGNIEKLHVRVQKFTYKNVKFILKFQANDEIVPTFCV